MTVGRENWRDGGKLWRDLQILKSRGTPLNLAIRRTIVLAALDRRSKTSKACQTMATISKSSPCGFRPDFPLILDSNDRFGT